jgi:hypothetical protein
MMALTSPVDTPEVWAFVIFMALACSYQIIADLRKEAEQEKKQKKERDRDAAN